MLHAPDQTDPHAEHAGQDASGTDNSMLHCRVQYVLEVMKNGQIVETKQLEGREHFTFGRSPQCDVRAHALYCMQHCTQPSMVYCLCTCAVSCSC